MARTLPKIATEVFALALYSSVLAEANETTLKAEFLVRFAGFTTWPSSSFQDASSPVIIGVWNDGKFTSTLSFAIGTRTTAGRRIVAKTVRQTSEIHSLHILFIPSSGAQSVDRILSATSRLPVLTVSEISGFCSRGGALNFYRDGDFIRFEANPDGAQNVGLQISSQLLRLARIVRKQHG